MKRQDRDGGRFRRAHPAGGGFRAGARLRVLRLACSRCATLTPSCPAVRATSWRHPLWRLMPQAHARRDVAMVLQFAECRIAAQFGARDGSFDRLEFAKFDRHRLCCDRNFRRGQLGKGAGGPPAERRGHPPGPAVCERSSILPGQEWIEHLRQPAMERRAQKVHFGAPPAEEVPRRLSALSGQSLATGSGLMGRGCEARQQMHRYNPRRVDKRATSPKRTNS